MITSTKDLGMILAAMAKLASEHAKYCVAAMFAAGKDTPDTTGLLKLEPGRDYAPDWKRTLGQTTFGQDVPGFKSFTHGGAILMVDRMEVIPVYGFAYIVAETEGQTFLLFFNPTEDNALYVVGSWKLPMDKFLAPRHGDETDKKGKEKKS